MCLASSGLLDQSSPGSRILKKIMMKNKTKKKEEEKKKKTKKRKITPETDVKRGLLGPRPLLRPLFFTLVTGPRRSLSLKFRPHCVLTWTRVRGYHLLSKTTVLFEDCHCTKAGRF